MNAETDRLAAAGPAAARGNPFWPIFGLRIEAPPLLLRPMTEADQPMVADLLPTTSSWIPAP